MTDAVYWVTQLSVSASEKRSFRQYESDDRSVHLVAQVHPGSDLNEVAKALGEKARAALRLAWEAPIEKVPKPAQAMSIPDPATARHKASQQQLGILRDMAKRAAKAGVKVDDLPAPTWADEVPTADKAIRDRAAAKGVTL